MAVFIELLHTMDHILCVVVYFVDFGVVIVEFLVEDLYDFLLLFEFVSQVMEFGLNVGFYHPGDLLR